MVDLIKTAFGSRLGAGTVVPYLTPAADHRKSGPIIGVHQHELVNLAAWLKTAVK
jgi:hypothetical protein